MNIKENIKHSCLEIKKEMVITKTSLRKLLIAQKKLGWGGGQIQIKYILIQYERVYQLLILIGTWTHSDNWWQ